MDADEADLDWLRWHTEPGIGSPETQRRARNVLAELERLRGELAADRNVDAVRITRERLDQLERADEALRHVAAERDRHRAELARLRPIEQRARKMVEPPLTDDPRENAALWILHGERS